MRWPASENAPRLLHFGWLPRRPERRFGLTWLSATPPFGPSVGAQTRDRVLMRPLWRSRLARAAQVFACPRDSVRIAPSSEARVWAGLYNCSRARTNCNWVSNGSGIRIHDQGRIPPCNSIEFDIMASTLKWFPTVLTIVVLSALSASDLLCCPRDGVPCALRVARDGVPCALRAARDGVVCRFREFAWLSCWSWEFAWCWVAGLQHLIPLGPPSSTRPVPEYQRRFDAR